MPLISRFLVLTLFCPHSLYCPDMKTQPESAVHTPFTKRQPYQAATSTSSMLDVFLQDKGLPPSSSVSSSSSLPQQTTSSPHVAPPPASSLPKMTAVPSLGQQVSPSSSDAQGSSPLPLQQHKLKQQKKRTSITTKVRCLTCIHRPTLCRYGGIIFFFYVSICRDHDWLCCLLVWTRVDMRVCSSSDSSNGSGDAWFNRHLRPQSSVRSVTIWVWTSSTRVRGRP